MSKRSQVWHGRVTVTPGALASGAAAAVMTKVDGSLSQDFRLGRIRCLMELEGKTNNDGPLSWGYSIGLNTTEVAETLVADPQYMEDQGEEEANRKVMPCGMIHDNLVTTYPESTTPKSMSWDLFRDMPSPSWKVPRQEQINFWVYNWGATMSTGSTITWTYVITGKWELD